MLSKNLVTLVALSCTFHATLFGLSLKESVVEVLNTNPVIQEKLKNFRVTQQDLNMAESEYYPELDLKATYGYTKSGEHNSDVVDSQFRNYESSLTLTQNIFDGFGTMHKVDYQEARILAAAYKYLEVSNDMTYKMTSAYINVLSSHELAQTARENVQINEEIYLKVKELFDSGLTTDSEVKKIQSALSLARSNLTVKRNNARDARFTFRRVLGRMPEMLELEKPEFNVAMPESIERAAMYSIEHNPSLLVSNYNVKGAQDLWKQRKKDNYPKIDLKLSQVYNDAERNPLTGPDDRFNASVVLTYNLFRGGYDSANVQKHLTKINQEIEIKRELKRQVIEGLELSWSAYEMLGKQLKDLREYSMFSEKTLELYREEYDLGRRSLLDLLSAQNDVINSRSEIIKAEYDQLFAKYRVLDAMGLLTKALVGDTQEFTSKVNLYGDSDALEILDTLPTRLDVDNDNVSDNLDLCDNSLKENNIMPYGCKKVIMDNDSDGVIDSKDSCPITPLNVEVSEDGCALDSDMDGVVDYKDSCPATPLNVKVSEDGCAFDSDMDGVIDSEDSCPTTPLNVKVSKDGCAFDSDKDGVKNYQDKCLNTPFGHSVDEEGCSISLSLKIVFKANSLIILINPESEIEELAKFLKENKNYKAMIVGHTSKKIDNKANNLANLKLSEQRADLVKNLFELQGVDKNRLASKGQGGKHPIASNETAEGRYLNRRVEIELIKESEER